MKIENNIFYCLLLYIYFYSKYFYKMLRECLFRKILIEFHKIIVYNKHSLYQKTRIFYIRILLYKKSIYMIISFFNKTLSKYQFPKNALTFRRLFFKSTKEKMKIGHENRKMLFSIVYYYIFYFSSRIF